MRSTRGLTLIEILVALLILVVAGGGIVGAHLSSNQMLEYSLHTMKAVDDLEDLVERIRSTPYNLVTARFPSGAADGGGATDYAGLVGGYTLDNEQITVTYPSLQPGRMEILVTVTWTSRQRARTARLSTIRTST